MTSGDWLALRCTSSPNLSLKSLLGGALLLCCFLLLLLPYVGEVRSVEESDMEENVLFRNLFKVFRLLSMYAYIIYQRKVKE